MSIWRVTRLERLEMEFGTIVTLAASGGRVAMYGSDIVFEEIESSS